MATATLKVYPFIKLDEGGKVISQGAFSFQSTEGFEAYSYREGGEFTINLPPVELEISYPDDCRAACVELLKVYKGVKTADHQQLMTQVQFVQNNLLGLAAPEILDAQ